MRWLTIFLRWLILILALALGAIVLIAPYTPLETNQKIGTRIWNLFAIDPVTRRVAIVSALGLLMTALIFFRSAPRPAAPASEE